MSYITSLAKWSKPSLLLSALRLFFFTYRYCDIRTHLTAKRTTGTPVLIAI